MDPTQAATEAAAAGVVAMFIAFIGVEPQGLLWAFVGAVFGLTFAPPAGRVRAAGVFVAVALASALLGTWMAELYHDGSRMARNGWALGIAACFHPILSTVVESVPSALRAAINAVIAARTPGGGGQ